MNSGGNYLFLKSLELYDYSGGSEWGACSISSSFSLLYPEGCIFHIFLYLYLRACVCVEREGGKSKC